MSLVGGVTRASVDGLDLGELGVIRDAAAGRGRGSAKPSTGASEVTFVIVDL